MVCMCFVKSTSRFKQAHVHTYNSGLHYVSGEVETFKLVGVDLPKIAKTFNYQCEARQQLFVIFTPFTPFSTLCM